MNIRYFVLSLVFPSSHKNTLFVVWTCIPLHFPWVPGFSWVTIVPFLWWYPLLLLLTACFWSWLTIHIVFHKCVHWLHLSRFAAPFSFFSLVTRNMYSVLSLSRCQSRYRPVALFRTLMAEYAILVCCAYMCQEELWYLGQLYMNGATIVASVFQYLSSFYYQYFC